MQALEHYNLYFLDSMTIGNSRAMRAASGTGVKVIKRKVFLDDTQNEADIRRQFNRAIELARRNGSAIAIGHPHPATVRVLQQMVYRLPADITVRPCSLLNEPQVDTSRHGVTPQKIDAPRNPFRGVKMCKPKTAATGLRYALFQRHRREHYAKFRGCLVSASVARLGKIAAPKNVSAKTD